MLVFSALACVALRFHVRDRGCRPNTIGASRKASATKPSDRCRLLTAVGFDGRTLGIERETQAMYKIRTVSPTRPELRSATHADQPYRLLAKMGTKISGVDEVIQLNI